VSFFGLFCHYHAKALSGGQINMEVGTTDFGRYGLIADGKSTTPIFTAASTSSTTAWTLVGGVYTPGTTTFSIGVPSAGSGWFGDVNRPAINMLAEVTIGGTVQGLYPILTSSPIYNGSGVLTGYNVTISNPQPSNRSVNLGLTVGYASGATWRFYLRSMVSTASHTMEYAGSGTDYTALPENGGVAQEANEAVNRNGGKVWLTSTDQSGKFKVGDTFAVDQQTGFVTIDPQSISTNVVSDLTPELGGDLDVLARNIYSSVGDIGINDAFNTGVNLMLVRESSLATAYPVVTQVDIGTDPNQVPINGYLGTMAFQDSDGVNIGAASIGTASVNLGSAAAPAISFTGDSNTGIYSPGADQFAISTGGTGRVFVDAGGRTGFGVSTPGYRCDIQDAANIRIDGSNFANLYFHGTGTRIRYNDASGNLSFFTNSTERAYVGYGGGFYVTSGGLNIAAGITFPATAVASADPNTLDDYEEGIWTPSLGGTATYTTNQATYTKIGRTVYVTAYIAVNSIGTGSTTTITGLPFSTATTSNWVNPARVAGSVTNVVSINWTASGTSALLRSRTAAAADDAANAIFQGSTLVELNGFYFV
jgi:hypothetical protein